MASVSETWGTNPEERQLVFACDSLIVHPDAAVYRGVTIHTSKEVIFRWLCQMRVAPYSYDWIDNAGRESPRSLTPGLEQLAIGQDIMEIFNLVAFAPNEHLTIRVKSDTRAHRVFGDIAGSYLIVPKTHSSCRLLVKLIARYPRGAIGALMRSFLPWGDLVMMRRQLLNFKQFAEQGSHI